MLLATASAVPADRAIILSSSPFIAEGVAATGDGRFLVSGVAGRTILVVDRTGTPRPWLRPGRFAPVGGLFGMAVDRGRNRLWVAETFGAGVPGQSGPSRTGLLEVALGSGRVLARHPAPGDGRTRTIGDVAVAADGSVYASDSTSGGLYRLDCCRGALRLLVETGLRSPQGMVPSRDGQALLVADYATGLHRIALRGGERSPLGGEAAGTRGVDGLVRDGAFLIATQNGGTTQRVLRFRLAPDEGKVLSVETLAEGAAAGDDLSLGTVAGRRFVFVSHSQWSAVRQDGSLAPDPAPALLSSIGLASKEE